MENLKVIKVEKETIEFENGVRMYSDHESDCCEHHWLSFEHLTMDDFDGLTFDLSGDSFFKKVEGYGIEFIPVNGHPVRIPGYGSNNGYYSTELRIVIDGNGLRKEYDITECQVITE